VWCQDNLSLKVIKTKELIVDYRRKRLEHATIYINWDVVEKVESFKLLSVHIAKDLAWSTVTKKARHHLFLPSRVKRFGMGPRILKKFYSCTIESILTGCINTELPGIQDQYTRQCQNISKDSSHPSHRLFTLL
jgi:hypothetical protein